MSYAHADKIPVYQSMREFRDAGVNMWYDEGIQPAGEWVEEIAHAIKKSAIFVVFVSPRSVDSRFVKSEVGYALSENKDILTIYLEHTTLPAGLSLCLQQFQSVFVSETVAALLSFGHDGFDFEYVGNLELAKNFGSYPIYILQRTGYHYDE